MLLYHYSKEAREILLTKRAATGDRRVRKIADITDPPYDDHISFFFDPIPSRILPTLFDANHHAWFKGNVLIEHIVDTDVLENDVLFHVVESVKKTALLDAFTTEHNWVEDDPKLLKMWFELIDAKMLEWGEIGRGKKLLSKQIMLNVGKTESLFLAARKRYDWETSKHRYASNVPHVMVYPSTGAIPVKTRNKLTIGNDKRELIDFDKASFKW